MSMAKPDSMSGGDPYSFGSTGTLLFQRAFFIVLLIGLIAGFLAFLLSLDGGDLQTRVLLLSPKETRSYFSLGVPFQKPDFDFVETTLGDEQVVRRVLESPGEPVRFREMVADSRSPETLGKTAVVVFLKAYGDVNGDRVLTQDSSSGESPTEAPVLRVGRGAIAATSLIDQFFAMDTDADVSPEVAEKTENGDNPATNGRVPAKARYTTAAAPRLLIMDCSHAVSNFRIGMFSNSFPALIRQHLQAHGDNFPENCWIMMPCGVNQLSLPNAELTQSAFAVALSEGLKGKADLETKSGGNNNGRVDLQELYNFVCDRCSTETQTPILLNASGTIAKPFDTADSPASASVLAMVPEDVRQAAAEAAAKSKEKPATENTKDTDNGTKTPERTAGATEMSPGGWLRRRSTHRSAAAVVPVMGATMWKASKGQVSAEPQTNSSASVSQNAAGADEASGSNPDGNILDKDKGKDSKESEARFAPRGSSDNSTPDSGTPDEKPPGQNKPGRKPGALDASGQNATALSEESMKWESMRSRVTQMLSEYEREPFDFLAIRRIKVVAAEDDFHKRLQAGPLSEVELPINPARTERADITKAQNKATRLGRSRDLHACSKAWSSLLNARLHLPSYVEWHDHLVLMNPALAADYRVMIETVLSDIERLESQIRSFEDPIQMDSAAIKEAAEELFRSLITCEAEVTIQLESAPDAGMLMSMLRTPLLSGLQRDRAIRKMTELLSERPEKRLNNRAVEAALAMVRPASGASSLHVRLAGAEDEQGSISRLYDQLAARVAEPEAASGFDKTLKWYQHASSLRAEDCLNGPRTSPLCRLPLFPSTPQLDLRFSNRNVTASALRIGEESSLRFQVELSGMDNSSDLAGRNVTLQIDAEPGRDLQLRLRSENLEPQEIREPISVEADLDQFGKAEFEITALTNTYAEAKPGQAAPSEVFLRVSVSTEIGNSLVAAEPVTALLTLPWQEKVSLEVDGDSRIPATVGSHRRTLRVLPNTVTRNTLKLRNETLRNRIVRVELVALKELPQAAWTPGLLYASDPSLEQDADLFRRLEDAYRNNPDVLLGPVVARSEPFPLPFDNSAHSIPFAPASSVSSPTVAPGLTNGSAAPDKGNVVDVSNGLLMRVIDVVEQKVGDKVTAVDAEQSWIHWLEVIPVRPSALFDAVARWNSSEEKVRVVVSRRSPAATGEKTLVRYSLADSDGWTLQQSELIELSEQGYTFSSVSFSDDNLSVYVDIDEYPRALRVDIPCREGRDAEQKPRETWEHFRFQTLGDPTEYGFVRLQQGFRLQRKEPQTSPDQLFQIPFFDAKSNAAPGAVRRSIPLGLQIDFQPKSERNPRLQDAANGRQVLLSGSRELENSGFPRDRQHQITMTGATGTGVLEIGSVVRDWTFLWTPFTSGDTVPLRIGPAPDATGFTAKPDQVSIRIDGTPPEFHVSLGSRTVEIGREVPLTVTTDDADRSAPIEKIEFAIVDADTPDQPFDEAQVIKPLTLSWPEEDVALTINPARLMLMPGRFVIKARATDALGRQNAAVRSEVLTVKEKPMPKKEMEDNAPKMGLVKIRFHFKDMPLTARMQFTATFSGKSIPVPSSGLVTFAKEVPLEVPVKVTVSGRVGNSVAETKTIEVAPVPKEGTKDEDIPRVDLSAPAAGP